MQMEGKEKLLDLKLDGLQKHSSRWKSLITRLGVVMGDYYQSV
jgi:hypothetical protein